MNKLRKLTCLLLAMVMVFALAATASAADGTNKITIKNASDGHIYEAYQIFIGDYSEGKLSNIAWGDGVTTDGQTALQNQYDTTEGEKSAAGVAEALTNDNAKAFAEDVSKYLSQTKSASGTYNNGSYEISVPKPGYYLVIDQSGSLSGEHEAYTAFILQVAGTAEVSPKSAKPSVDKQVHDEPADAETGHADGWGETADHAINESFQFKLIATLPADPDFEAYDKYKVTFNDTMSDGVTFESIVSVTVGGKSIADSDYTCTATAGQEGGSWSLTIENIKIDGVELKNGTEVVVIYNAHLNEKAHVNHETGNTTNKNTVSLEYSNNPNAEGMGKTPEDTVWVFTYKVENTKYKNALPADDGDPLAGAGFSLYQGEKEVPLIYDDSLQAYRPTKTNETGEEMKSAADGKFNIVGLDAGTYTLKETTTPTGYNTCEDITITISANHSESADGASATTTLTSESNMTNNIVNKSGSTLPETGGIGTTLFYVLGGVLVLAAVVLLVTKKRMRSEN